MMTEQKASMIEEQKQQSTKNFLRLYQSVVEQTGCPLESVIECALTSIIRLMIANSGVELTSEYLRTLADSLDAENTLDLGNGNLH